jgi:biotin carboxyl carrier protein
MSSYTLDQQQVESLGNATISWDHERFFSIHHLGKVYRCELLNNAIEDGSLTVKVNQRIFEVKKNHPLDDLIKSLGLDKQKVKKLHQLQSPMPGRILSYAVEVGANVAPGTPLLTLEAMKMENVIKAEGEGIVKSILQPSAAVVEKGQVLIEFE